MIRVNIAEAKAHFSHLLRRAKAGVQIVICQRNEPIAELRGLPPPPTGRRKLGQGPHGVQIPPSFYEPLPEDVLGAFEGAEGGHTAGGPV